MSENKGDFLTWEEQERRIRRVQERFGEIKACIDALPPYETIRDAMRRLGAQMTPAECGIDAPSPESVHALRKRLSHALYALQDAG